jgi:hypothetical protein
MHGVIGTVNLFADVRPNTQYLWIANLSGKRSSIGAQVTLSHV